MTHNIFFSWQSDHTSRVCKNLIEWSLNKAITNLAADLEVIDAMREEDIELDKDTKGVPGSPPIVETILNKISEAKIFVPDFTFVGKRIGGHPTPNPNVLIEYGWALRCHSHSRVIAVMNDAFGKPTFRATQMHDRYIETPEYKALLRGALNLMKV